MLFRQRKDMRRLPVFPRSYQQRCSAPTNIHERAEGAQGSQGRANSRTKANFSPCPCRENGRSMPPTGEFLPSFARRLSTMACIFTNAKLHAGINGAAQSHARAISQGLSLRSATLTLHIPSRDTFLAVLANKHRLFPRRTSRCYQTRRY